MLAEAMPKIQRAPCGGKSGKIACQKAIRQHLLFYDISNLSRFCFKFLGYFCFSEDIPANKTNDQANHC
jgi:hypothetical protein